MDLRELSAPKYAIGLIYGRVQGKPTKNGTCKYVPYIDVRGTRLALNTVVGPERWGSRVDREAYEISGGTSAVVTIVIKGTLPGHTEKSGQGFNDTKGEAGVKGAVSDAEKRAGFEWGIGECLYDLSDKWVKMDGSYPDRGHAKKILKEWNDELEEMQKRWDQDNAWSASDPSENLNHAQAEETKTVEVGELPVEVPAKEADDLEEKLKEEFDAEKMDDTEHKEAIKRRLRELSNNKDKNPDRYSIVREFVLGKSGGKKFSMKAGLEVMWNEFGEKASQGDLVDCVKEWMAEHESSR